MPSTRRRLTASNSHFPTVPLPSDILPDARVGAGGWGTIGLLEYAVVFLAGDDLVGPGAVVELQRPATLSRMIRRREMGKASVEKQGTARFQRNRHGLRRIDAPFHAQIGEAPKRFNVSMRIQRAVELLRETTLQVQEIADRLGYPDVYFFSRQFRREMGRSPRKYRKESPQ